MIAIRNLTLLVALVAGCAPPQADAPAPELPVEAPAAPSLRFDAEPVVVDEVWTSRRDGLALRQRFRIAARVDDAGAFPPRDQFGFTIRGATEAWSIVGVELPTEGRGRDVIVQFLPPGPGDYPASLALTEATIDGYGAIGDLPEPIALAASVAGANLEGPSVVWFRDVPAGCEQTRRITVTSRGPAGLRVGHARVLGEGDHGFRVLTPPDYELTLYDRDSVQFEVAWQAPMPTPDNPRATRGATLLIPSLDPALPGLEIDLGAWVAADGWRQQRLDADTLRRSDVVVTVDRTDDAAITARRVRAALPELLDPLDSAGARTRVLPIHDGRICLRSYQPGPLHPSLSDAEARRQFGLLAGLDQSPNAPEPASPFALALAADQATSEGCLEGHLREEVPLHVVHVGVSVPPMQPAIDYVGALGAARPRTTVHAIARESVCSRSVAPAVFDAARLTGGEVGCLTTDGDAGAIWARLADRLLDESSHHVLHEPAAAGSVTVTAGGEPVPFTLESNGGRVAIEVDDDTPTPVTLEWFTPPASCDRE